VLQLIGRPPADADSQAKAIMALETSLANASLDNVQRRNPRLMVHKMPASEFESLSVNFDFKQYFSDMAVPAFSTINVRVPEFFKSFNATLASTSLDDLKSYLMWHYLSNYAPQLSSRFVNENFDFYQRYLTGAKELQPRWKRCVQLTDRELGEALGKSMWKEHSARMPSKRLWNWLS
jgi:predicted metalloendopeptidase